MLKSCKSVFYRTVSREKIKCLSTFPEYRLENLDLKYLCNESNLKDIALNIKRRKGPGDIKAVLRLNKNLSNASADDKLILTRSLIDEVLKIPNRSHPEIFSLPGEPKVVHEIGEVSHNFKSLPFENISKKLNLTRSDNLTNLTGDRSYYLIDQAAELEQALIDYAVDFILKSNFKLISVPDILPRQVIEACGMSTQGERTQVYCLDEETHGKDLCLSGTAEMGIASMLVNKNFSPDELPLRFVAVSRCFRAETSKIAEEKGIYRVHAFTKVEMFGVSRPEESSSMLSEFVSLEEKLFSSLGLKLRTLDMPPEELGAQAYRKYDVEAWLPGRKRWAELSSASDCTDYQSRRLNIKMNDTPSPAYPHTLNGTAAAIPRLIIAIVETHQKQDGTVSVPQPLRNYLNFSSISKSRLPQMLPYKGRTFYP